jgi:hypothetical protein
MKHSDKLKVLAENFFNLLVWYHSCHLMHKHASLHSTIFPYACQAMVEHFFILLVLISVLL